MKSTIVKHSVMVAGHKTSVSMEDEFWDGLRKIAEDRHTSRADLIASIDAARHKGNLSSAIRLFVLGVFRDRSTASPAHDGVALQSLEAAPLVSSDLQSLR
jgi:predicted DNA-binding ribbon-helix-helix protein